MLNWMSIKFIIFNFNCEKYLNKDVSWNYKIGDTSKIKKSKYYRNINVLCPQIKQFEQ